MRTHVQPSGRHTFTPRRLSWHTVVTSADVAGTDGDRLGVGNSSWEGALVGVLVGAGVGVAVFVGVAVGTTTGILALTGGVRGGEVRCGRGGLGVAMVFVGTDGLITAGGRTVCGGSDPGEWGCSAMTPPVTTRPVTARALAARR